VHYWDTRMTWPPQREGGEPTGGPEPEPIPEPAEHR